MDDLENEHGEQAKNSPADRIRAWQFQPGESGNPSGRPKGTVSLKEFAKKYLRELDDDQKLEFMKGLKKDTIWEMGEGKADTKTDLQVGGVITEIIKYEKDKNSPQLPA